MSSLLPPDLPIEVKALMDRARSGAISALEFARSLDDVGITGAEKILYIAEALALPLDRAKELWVTADFGSVDAWSAEMCEAVDEISTKLVKRLVEKGEE